jgi:deoxyhypusine synthase
LPAGLPSLPDPWSDLPDTPAHNTGVPKHHICNANLMRNGADFAVYLNTAQEFDGSDSGARPDEAISWGKIRIDAKPVKVCGDATILFPLLVSQTFVRHWKPVEPLPEKKADAEAGKGVVAVEAAPGLTVFKAGFD